DAGTPAPSARDALCGPPRGDHAAQARRPERRRGRRAHAPDAAGDLQAVRAGSGCLARRPEGPTVEQRHGLPAAVSAARPADAAGGERGAAAGAGEDLVQGMAASEPGHEARLNALRELDQLIDRAREGGMSVPRQLATYKLLTCLGRGGMGTVYLAEHVEDKS